jgi:hypothetical protein
MSCVSASYSHSCRFEDNVRHGPISMSQTHDPAIPPVPPPAPGLQIHTYQYEPSPPAGIDPTTGQPPVSVGTRFAAALIDALIYTFTLGIGWVIWAAFTAGNGQTPGKKIVGFQMVRTDTGQPASFAEMLAMRGIVAGFAMSLAFGLLVGLVLVFMPFWDARNQTPWDKISSTVARKI